jgi:hypothetical protein
MRKGLPGGKAYCVRLGISWGKDWADGILLAVTSSAHLP